MGHAEAVLRDAVKAESCALAAAMRPSGCIDSDGVRCSGACGSTSSASGSAGPVCFSSSARHRAHSRHSSTTAHMYPSLKLL